MTLLFRGVLRLFMMAVEHCSVAQRSVLRHSLYYHLFILHNPTILLLFSNGVQMFLYELVPSYVLQRHLLLCSETGITNNQWC